MGGFAKIGPSLFFLFFFFFFFFCLGGPCFWVLIFFFFFGGGVGVLSGWLPDKTGNQWEMSSGEGTNHHHSFLYYKSESYIQIIMWLSNIDVDIYNFMMDSFKLNSASNRTCTFPIMMN